MNSLGRFLNQRSAWFGMLIGATLPLVISWLPPFLPGRLIIFLISPVANLLGPEVGDAPAGRFALLVYYAVIGYGYGRFLSMEKSTRYIWVFGLSVLLLGLHFYAYTQFDLLLWKK